mmetsp:Transcript_6516/g.26549  ORF Transcript_6516/g.26549 Transcript_6516/m.26549 type:complete len:359 (-) Transcript_6516:1246-2322(-)
MNIHAVPSLDDASVGTVLGGTAAVVAPSDAAAAALAALAAARPLMFAASLSHLLSTSPKSCTCTFGGCTPRALRPSEVASMSLSAASATSSAPARMAAPKSPAPGARSVPASRRESPSPPSPSSDRNSSTSGGSISPMSSSSSPIPPPDAPMGPPPPRSEPPPLVPPFPLPERAAALLSRSLLSSRLASRHAAQLTSSCSCVNLSSCARDRKYGVRHEGASSSATASPVSQSPPSEIWSTSTSTRPRFPSPPPSLPAPNAPRESESRSPKGLPPSRARSPASASTRGRLPEPGSSEPVTEAAASAVADTSRGPALLSPSPPTVTASPLPPLTSSLASPSSFSRTAPCWSGTPKGTRAC